MASPVGTVKIALVGKYVDLPDAYLSVDEALRHAGAHHRVKVEIQWIASDSLVDDGARLADVDGILVPGGFGVRGWEGKIEAVRYARDAERPVLRDLPRPPGRRDRVRAPRVRHARRRLERVQRVDASTR